MFQKLPIQIILSKIPTALFILLLTLMFLPLLQSQTELVYLYPLVGAIDEPKKDTFNNEDWFSGKYQEGMEKYFNESFGFRNTCIRINNQISFEIDKKANANGVIIGKDNYLYEYNYIKAYYGSDYIGYDSINDRMQKIKYIHDTLKALHKDLIIVFAPGKASFYPEFIPDNLKTEKNITNYETYVDLAKKLHISHIDFNKYFIDHKSTSKYPLYPQYGIHWSNYSICLVTDSLLRYIENSRKIDMNTIYWDDVTLDQPQLRDYDIADGMNLLFKLKSFEMGYPEIKYESGKIKPSVLSIGDSFYWGIFNLTNTTIFSNSHFWYYNKQIFPESYKSLLETKDVNLKDEITRHDVIIIMATESNLPKLGWGFIENTYEAFKK